MEQSNKNLKKIQFFFFLSNTSPDEGVATGKQILQLYNEGSTMQFHQPQQVKIIHHS